MNPDALVATIQSDFGRHVLLKERKPGVYQVFVPFYHEDGDMIDLFIRETGEGKIRVEDLGKTLMRLSYTYDIDTPKKNQIFDRILSENQIGNDQGSLFVEVQKESIYPAINHLASVIFKITSMEYFKREVISSLFFEELEKFINTKLAKYHPEKDHYPIPEKKDYKVDYKFNSIDRPLFLFAVNNKDKCSVATICCHFFHEQKKSFRSIAVTKSIDDLPKSHRNRLLTVIDKIFPSIEDFEENAEEYFAREYGEIK